HEARALAHELELAALEHAPQVVLEHGEEQRLAPVDVEQVGEAAVLPVLEHVPPPAVAAVGDAHVVGHDVEDEPEPGVARGGGELLEADAAAELLADAGGVDEVVAVLAALGGL